MTLEKLPDDVMQLKTLALENYQRANEYLDKYKNEELRANGEHQRAELYNFKFERLVWKNLEDM